MIKNYILKLLTENRKHIYIKTYSKVNKIIKKLNKYYIHSFGNKNSNKVFYVIRRSPGAGFFSNLILVLNHLKICEKKKYIPIVDMENFVTVYNERQKINNTFNRQKII